MIAKSGIPLLELIQTVTTSYLTYRSRQDKITNMVLPNSKQWRSSFFRSFMEGLAAPTLLDSMYRLPAIPYLARVTVPNITCEQALASDWKKIGADFYSVIERHGKTQRAIQLSAIKKRSRKRR